MLFPFPNVSLLHNRYTDEQQTRLGVDAFGNPTARGTNTDDAPQAPVDL